MRALVLALLLAACAGAPERSPVGEVLHYTRSNHDGSMAERIIVYREGATRVAVAKMVEPCTNAAYVTADLSPISNEALRLVGGRLTRDLTQDPFATITLDPVTSRLTTRVELPDRIIEETLEEVRPPWRLYDFDLADLTAVMQGQPAPLSDFSFIVVLVWPEETGGPFVTLRDRAEVVFAGQEQRRGHDAVRYDVSGALNGELWLDADEGHVIEARFAEPNHPGYDNFLIVLDERARGAETWRSALSAHWQGC